MQPIHPKSRNAYYVLFVVDFGLCFKPLHLNSYKPSAFQLPAMRRDLCRPETGEIALPCHFLLLPVGDSGDVPNPSLPGPVSVLEL